MEKQTKKRKRKSSPKKRRLSSVKRLLKDKDFRDFIIKIIKMIVDSTKR